MLFRLLTSVWKKANTSSAVTLQKFVSQGKIGVRSSDNSPEYRNFGFQLTCPAFRLIIYLKRIEFTGFKKSFLCAWYVRFGAGIDEFPQKA